MRSPTRVGALHQSASFQLAMRRLPHWRCTTSATASGTPAGQGAERVAVEVDHSRREAEATAKVGAGVLGVEGSGPVHQR